MQEHARRLWCRAGFTFAVALSVLVLSLAGLTAAQDAGGADAEEQEEPEFAPRTGAPPARRVGAGTRTPGATLNIVGLAPADTLGYTTRERPTLYFSLSRGTDAPVEVSVNDLEDAANPVWERELKDGHRGGLLKVDLAEAKTEAGGPVRLEPGRRYEVVVQASENRGSANPAAVVRIDRLSPEQAAPPKDPARQPAWFAKNGVWFDYLDVLNRRLEADPKDEAARAARRKLLEPQGLTERGDGAIVEEPAEGKERRKPE